jgi:hypothetical protein
MAQDSRSIADTVANRLELKHAACDLMRVFPSRGETNSAILISLASGFQNREMGVESGKRGEASAEQLEAAVAATADIADSLTAMVREKMENTNAKNEDAAEEN